MALGIGTIEMLQVFIGLFGLKGTFFDAVAGLDFATVGYAIVGVFLVAWGISVAVWKFARIEERHGARQRVHVHEHSHDGGRSHSHKHFH